MLRDRMRPMRNREASRSGWRRGLAQAFDELVETVGRGDERVLVIAASMIGVVAVARAPPPSRFDALIKAARKVPAGLIPESLQAAPEANAKVRPR